MKQQQDEQDQELQFQNPYIEFLQGFLVHEHDKEDEQEPPEEAANNIGCSTIVAENISKSTADLIELYNSALAIVPSYGSLCAYGIAIQDAAQEKWGQLLEEVPLNEAVTQELDEQQQQQQAQKTLVNRLS